jgi:hypothetical protein
MLRLIKKWFFRLAYIVVRVTQCMAITLANQELGAKDFDYVKFSAQTPPQSRRVNFLNAWPLQDSNASTPDPSGTCSTNASLLMSAFGGKADITFCAAHICL